MYANARSREGMFGYKEKRREKREKTERLFDRSRFEGECLIERIGD
jgi:hypothetical protein